MTLHARLPITAALQVAARDRETMARAFEHYAQLIRHGLDLPRCGHAGMLAQFQFSADPAAPAVGINTLRGSK